MENEEMLKLIDAEIAEIKSDERFNYPRASVFSNAPLALIQSQFHGQLAALEKLRSVIGFRQLNIPPRSENDTEAK